MNDFIIGDVNEDEDVGMSELSDKKNNLSSFLKPSAKNDTYGLEQDDLDSHREGQSPSRLRGNLCIVFHTKRGHKMLVGSEHINKEKNKKVFTPGLKWFDHKLNAIVNAAYHDDPFADQLLVDIEDQTNELAKHFQTKIYQLQQKLNITLSEMNAMVSESTSTKPAIENVQFNHKLSNLILWRLKEFDQVIGLIMMLDHYALIMPSEARLLTMDAQRGIRNVIFLANNFKNTAVSREDIAQRTARAMKGIEENSKITLTREVLLLEKRSNFSPPIAVRTNGTLDETTKALIISAIATEPEDEESAALENGTENKKPESKSTDTELNPQGELGENESTESKNQSERVE